MEMKPVWSEVMTRRLMRLNMILGVMFLAASAGGIGGVGGSGQVFAQTPAVYRLASAQVVTSTVAPPVLKLTASGPVAFETLPADANGNPVGPGRVVARLFGVAPGDLAASFGDLAPFVLTVAPSVSANGTDADTIVTINTGAVSSGQELVMRAGMKSNEIEAAIVTIP
jgi:hypothetical protein